MILMTGTTHTVKDTRYSVNSLTVTDNDGRVISLSIDPSPNSDKINVEIHVPNSGEMRRFSVEFNWLLSHLRTLYQPEFD